MSDPIADMLTRIRNAQAAGKKEIILSSSRIKAGIAKILEKEGWVGFSEVTKNPEKNFGELRIVLKYREDGRPTISFLKRVSKPSLRVYAKKDKLPKVLNNFGMAIISTPKGLMTNKEARERKIGGEIICEIY